MNSLLNTLNDRLNDNPVNPIDSAEDIVSARNWAFTRHDDREIQVDIDGQYGSYRIHFIWEEDMNALQFCVQYVMEVHENNRDHAGQTLMHINQKLWMGHFDIPQDTNTPCFRYTVMLGGNSSEQNTILFGEILDIAMVQCERFFSAFHLLSSGNVAGGASSNGDTMSLALMETKGLS